MNAVTASTKTTSGVIAARLREQIMAGQLQAGQALNQDELARQHGVSKIPIREALHQLKAEGLVNFTNNRGSTVSTLSTSEVEEIYTMRSALESIALKRALPNLTEKHFIAAEAALQLIDVTPEPAEWPALNWQFHSSLYSAAQMPMLLSIVENLHGNVSRYLLLHLADPAHQLESQQEHRALLAACRERAGSTALRILRRHLSQASRQSQRLIKEAKGDYP